MPKKFAREPFCVSKKHFVPKFSCRGGGHHSSVNKFCLAGWKKIVGVHFDVSENLENRNVFRIIRRYHNFPSKNFCLSAVKNCMGAFLWLEIFECRKILCRVGWGHHIFVEVFCVSKYQQTFVLEPFGVSKNFRYRKTYAQEEVITFLRWSFLSQSADKVRKATHLYFEKIPWRKLSCLVGQGRGGASHFRRIFFLRLKIPIE